MLDFPEPPKSYAKVFLEETDKDLPKEINQRTRYAFFSTIAEGGKSLIKSCKDLHLSRFVCYKTLKPEFADNEIEQKRLIREARVSAMLQHPNTIPTYELSRDSRGYPYFTMKLVYGYTLREILDYRERYDLTQLMDVIMEVVYALNYAHTHGVAHRDIKPENILVGPFNEVLLMDWGLAKVWDPKGGTTSDEGGLETPIEDLTITAQGKAQGSVFYMSPEQVNQDPAIDYRTDVFSLGAVLYEILCGRPPARGEKMHDVVDSVLNDIPERPSRLTSMVVPSILEKVALRCLQKEPAARYGGMDEMLLQLQQDWRRELVRK